MKSQPTEPKVISDEEVLERIHSLEYGQVLVKVHQGRIVGYEVTDKKKA